MDPPAAAAGRSPPLSPLLSRTASPLLRAVLGSPLSRAVVAAASRAVLGSPLSRAVVAAASVFSSRLVDGRRAARGIAFAIGRPDACGRGEEAEGAVEEGAVVAGAVVAGAEAGAVEAGAVVAGAVAAVTDCA